MSTMGLSASLHFESIATAFRVEDIAQPLVTSAPPQWTIEDALAAITEDSAEHPENFFCLVRNESKILGYIAADYFFDERAEKYDGPRGGLAGQHCLKINPDQIVAAELPLIDLLSIFNQHFFFFVLKGNDLAYTVSFLDLEALPVKLCLFTLIIGLEEELLRVFTRESNQIEDFLRLLPDERRKKAEELTKQKIKKDVVSARQVLLSTNFVDKFTILVRSPELSRQLPFSSKSQAERYVYRLQELRNQIAHSDSILAILRTPDEFASFLTQLRQFMNVIELLARGSTD
jgi:hypothetical protein